MSGLPELCPDHGMLRSNGPVEKVSKLQLRNTCTEGQIDGIAGAAEDGGHERSHCSFTAAKRESLSQDADTSAGPRPQRKEVPRDLRNRGRQRLWWPLAAEA